MSTVISGEGALALFFSFLFFMFLSSLHLPNKIFSKDDESRFDKNACNNLTVPIFAAFRLFNVLTRDEPVSSFV